MDPNPTFTPSRPLLLPPCGWVNCSIERYIAHGGGEKVGSTRLSVCHGLHWYFVVLLSIIAWIVCCCWLISCVNRHMAPIWDGLYKSLGSVDWQGRGLTHWPLSSFSPFGPLPGFHEFKEDLWLKRETLLTTILIHTDCSMTCPARWVGSPNVINWPHTHLVSQTRSLPQQFQRNRCTTTILI